MSKTTYTIEQLRNLGFTEISDEQGQDFEYVIDPLNWFESDYLYAEKVGIGQYKIILYNNGECKELKNYEVMEVIGDKDFNYGK